MIFCTLAGAEGGAVLGGNRVAANDGAGGVSSRRPHRLRQISGPDRPHDMTDAIPQPVGSQRGVRVGRGHVEFGDALKGGAWW